MNFRAFRHKTKIILISKAEWESIQRFADFFHRLNESPFLKRQGKIYVFRGSYFADLRMGTEDAPLIWINEDIYRVYILYDQVSTVPSLLNKVCNSI